MLHLPYSFNFRVVKMKLGTHYLHDVEVCVRFIKVFRKYVLLE